MRKFKVLSGINTLSQQEIKSVYQDLPLKCEYATLKNNLSNFTTQDMGDFKPWDSFFLPCNYLSPQNTEQTEVNWTVF